MISCEYALNCPCITNVIVVDAKNFHKSYDRGSQDCEVSASV